VQAASRPYALAAAALTAISAVVVTPIMARQVPLAVRSMETKLVGIGDIPINLFDDILNIPYNEVEGGGLATVGASLLFTGTWWVPSSTNLWGIDPGDSTHIALIDNFLPFTAFTDGFTNSAGVYEPGLNYELDGLLGALLPVSAGCDAETCAPITPPEVITGSTLIDRDIGYIESVLHLGQAGYDDGGSVNAGDLFSHWFNLQPLLEMLSKNGYTFDNPGSIDPSGPVSPNDGWGGGWDGSGNPFEGGTGPGDTMPWNGVDFHLNLLAPIHTFIDSLTQDPTGVQVPTFEGIAHTFENLLAGTIIDFDPYTAGSPACPGQCDIPSSEQIPALVQDIYKLDPTNTTLGTWLTDYAAGTANEPTQEQINYAIALLQTGMYNLTSEQLTNYDAALASINPELPALFTNAGIVTDPEYLAYAGGSAPLMGEFGGYNPNLVFDDLLTLFTNNETNLAQLFDLNTLEAILFPAAGDLGTAAATDAGTAAASAAADPSWAADLATLLPNLF
jgi:hypothetical protein